MAGWLRFLDRFSAKGAEELLPREQRFRIGGREVVVRELTLAEIQNVAADLGEILKRIAREHPQVDIEHFEQHLAEVLPTLSGALEQFLSKLFRLPADFMLAEHLTPLLTMRLVHALLEVNQLPLLRAELRRIAELLQMTALAA